MPPSDSSPAGSTTTEPVDLGPSSPFSLHRAVRARKAEYVRPHRMRVKVGTWNVAACPGTDKDLASWFVAGRGLDAKLASLGLAQHPAVERDESTRVDDADRDIRLVGGDQVGLYVLGLQEIVDLNTATQYMTRVYAADHGPMEKWKAALQAALPDGYQLIASEQLSGLLLLIYASPEVAPTISNVSIVPVGTGLLGYLGNKGAVTVRIVVGEATKMVFVNSHLASGHEATYLDRRIWDVGQILNRTHFEPITFAGVSEEEGDKIGDEDFAFWFGDLNFRLDGLPGDDIRRLLMLHTRGEYDLKSTRREDSLEGEGIMVQSDSESSDAATDQESTTTRSTDPTADDASVSLPDPDEFLPDPHEDPASLQATLDSLLPHDQLRRTMMERKVFHEGWREGPITFLPSYKYDVGTVGLFDSSEKRRAPSWCDRILYRTRKDWKGYNTKIRDEEEARKKDEEMKARGIDQAGEDEEVLFDYDPATDGDSHPQGQSGFDYDEYDDGDDADEGLVVSNGTDADRIDLDIYTSHQRITSSDHKPILSVFTIDYDAVVPELKAKVHAEVARELDRAENEGRPGITVVVDALESGNTGKPSEDSSDHVVDFGEVQFLRRATTYLTLANTGGVAATFSFVEKPTTTEPEGGTLPQWLTTSFIGSDALDEEPGTSSLGKEVTLDPGETVKAVLEASVDDMNHARMLNDGQASLEEVLVLRVTDGRDHFIPVRAIWSPTCIGRSIEELIRVPDGGLKAFAKSLADRKGHNGSIPYDLDVRCAAPKELFKLTDAIESLTERALADEQMLDDCRIPKDPGWPFEEATWKYKDVATRASHLVNLIDVLDNDKPISDAFVPEIPSMERLETVSEVLLLFLRGLTDGIVTAPIWARIEQASLPSVTQSSTAPKSASNQVSEDDKTSILDILASAPNHNISFVFLFAALAKIVVELAPLSHANLVALKSDTTSRGITAIGKRPLSFRRSGTSAVAEAIAALERRQSRERLVAEIFAKVVCRVPIPEKDKDKKSLEDRQRAAVELFLVRRDDN